MLTQRTQVESGCPRETALRVCAAAWSNLDVVERLHERGKQAPASPIHRIFSVNPLHT